MAKLEIGQYVYHADVCDFKEPLEIVGIRKNQLELKGDFSGIGYPIDPEWFPIAGKVSRVYNHAEKVKFRKKAEDVLERYKEMFEKETFSEMLELANNVLSLTAEVVLNPIYQSLEK